MFRLVPFKPEHIQRMSNHGGQEMLVLSTPDHELGKLSDNGSYAVTGVDEDGQIVGCAGVLRANPYRGLAWALLQHGRPHDFMQAHMCVRKHFRETDLVRVEAYVNPLYRTHMRWARMLGFHLERAFVPYYFPDGSPAAEWVIYPSEVK